MPLESWPIILRLGRFRMATTVLPTSCPAHRTCGCRRVSGGACRCRRPAGTSAAFRTWAPPRRRVSCTRACRTWKSRLWYVRQHRLGLGLFCRFISSSASSFSMSMRGNRVSPLRTCTSAAARRTFRRCPRWRRRRKRLSVPGPSAGSPA
jgi:hypothetical protein